MPTARFSLASPSQVPRACLASCCATPPQQGCSTAEARPLPEQQQRGRWEGPPPRPDSIRGHPNQSRRRPIRRTAAGFVCCRSNRVAATQIGPLPSDSSRPRPNRSCVTRFTTARMWEPELGLVAAQRTALRVGRSREVRLQVGSCCRKQRIAGMKDGARRKRETGRDGVQLERTRSVVLWERVHPAYCANIRSSG